MSLVLMMLLETIALKEKANVAGRWVRVLDLVDADRTDSAARLRLADIYLGRAPEEGQTLTITLDEIRRELERRGLDPAAFSWRGDRVEVTTGDAVLVDDRRVAVAFAIQRHLMEREGEQVSVRVLQLQPRRGPTASRSPEIKSRTLAVLSNGTKVDVVARIAACAT